MDYKIFDTKEQAAAKLADELVQLIGSIRKPSLTIALSGGTTPFILFEEWAKNYSHKIPWEKIHFFWVDERCVEPSNPESNFGNTQKTLFQTTSIPESNIHRMKGEEPPKMEATRYTSELKLFTESLNNFPTFDIILLGLGDDGHTASIFPTSPELLTTNEWVAPTQNPYTAQTRLTLTGKVINNAQQIFFLVTGKGKSEIVANIFHQKKGFLNYPAAHIQPIQGKLKWYLDAEAASGI